MTDQPDNVRKMNKLAYAMLIFSIIQLAIYYSAFSGLLYGKEHLYSFYSSFNGVLIFSPQCLIMLCPALYSLFVEPKIVLNTFKLWMFLLVVGSAWSTFALHQIG